ncbi:DUF5805 domain-containing protein [Halobaculum magnesiiphilum]|uniref:DUF5805 domain-containing protein n=1 Tax=Halobaculum magnesiiphilum TaxID=1017351 RepID=A0A8T8WF91_9EURY|nr:DUF5805 domain-containing protein [Halobaculum magnesiiphilum]QZP38403.1 DUF5805 domain-containing protein [Halobaculum magnesiiphilum]
MSDADADTERVAVTARVPAYQKEAWVADAERLDMSQSEFLRTMVQAGRRDLGIADEFGPPAGTDPRSVPDHEDQATSAGNEEGASPPSHPRGDGLEDDLLGALSDAGVMSFDELVEAVTGDIEERVDETMGELQSRGLVRYSGRDGGYVPVER